MTPFEMRQKLRAWAKDQPDNVRHATAILCTNLRLFERYPNSPDMRNTIADQFKELKAM